MPEVRGDRDVTSAYVHVPFCRKRCFYCDFPVTVIGYRQSSGIFNWMSEYVTAVCSEITTTPKLGGSLKTVFFGGGTPSLLPLEDLEQIISSLDRHFGISADAEISIEIDPGTFNLERLNGYRSLGIDRLSLGVQSFDEELLRVCGRSHSVKDIYVAIETIARANIANFSLDLISGLPHQSFKQWQDSLKSAIELAPKHISCYDLVLEPVTAFGKKYQGGSKPLPSDEMTAKMYREATELLKAAGYEHYEVSNYAKPDWQCAHNRVYWENKAYYGFGMGAASYVKRQRFTRPRTRSEYYTWVENLIANNGVIDCPSDSEEDLILDTLMLGLRLKDGVSISQLDRQFGREVLHKIWSCLEDYYRQGLVELVEKNGKKITLDKIENILIAERLRLSDPDGFLFSNTVLTDLFEQFDRP